MKVNKKIIMTILLSAITITGCQNPLNQFKKEKKPEKKVEQKKEDTKKEEKEKEDNVNKNFNEGREEGIILEDVQPETKEEKTTIKGVLNTKEKLKNIYVSNTNILPANYDKLSNINDKEMYTYSLSNFGYVDYSEKETSPKILDKFNKKIAVRVIDNQFEADITYKNGLNRIVIIAQTENNNKLKTYTKVLEITCKKENKNTLEKPIISEYKQTPEANTSYVTNSFKFTPPKSYAVKFENKGSNIIDSSLELDEDHYRYTVKTKDKNPTKVNVKYITTDMRIGSGEITIDPKNNKIGYTFIKELTNEEIAKGVDDLKITSTKDVKPEDKKKEQSKPKEEPKKEIKKNPNDLKPDIDYVKNQIIITYDPVAKTQDIKEVETKLGIERLSQITSNVYQYEYREFTPNKIPEMEKILKENNIRYVKSITPNYK